ncbi:MAG TPA: hypothetical protein VLE95_07320 [Chlamydiales bacterium]|nr:hypothetical protein [Chlamydiales bacterium]
MHILYTPIIHLMMGLFFVTPGVSEKLVNMETGSIIVEFSNDTIRFHDYFLKAEMKQSGIYIPHFKKNYFDEKEIVYLGDPLFKKAFIEIYYPICIGNATYQWQN